MSGSPMFTPFATPIAMIAGQRRPAASARGTAGEQTGVRPAARRREHDRRRCRRPRHRTGRASRTNASAYPSAPVAVLPPIGIEYGTHAVVDQPRRDRLAGDLEFSPVVSAAPVKCNCAPNNDDRSWLPVAPSGPGSSPDSTRCTSRPSFAPAAAVIRQWFDCAAPTVTSACAPSASAAPHRNSSLRALLPPPPRPVRSSRFTESRAPPGNSGPTSSGVGSVRQRGPIEMCKHLRHARQPW